MTSIRSTSVPTVVIKLENASVVKPESFARKNIQDAEKPDFTERCIERT